MKKITILLAALFVSTALSVQAAPASLQTRIARAVLSKASTVNVTATLLKPVYMSDVMFRPPRGRNEIISYKRKINTCQGRLSQSGTYVYIPAACVLAADYQLEHVALAFQNGRTFTRSKDQVAWAGNVAFVRVPNAVLSQKIK
ncbi:MAG: hypothetical protein J6X06_06155 [Elusimicrobiaceae bacterium]|nr:hypothetical protein [Elusimicrobiaceae bacterium]